MDQPATLGRRVLRTSMLDRPTQPTGIPPGAADIADCGWRLSASLIPGRTRGLNNALANDPQSVMEHGLFPHGSVAVRTGLQ